MKIDFDGIQAFVATAELGSFNKAAAQLHLTQTALTRRIQKLEGYLGTRLLDRTTRSVDLTAAGRDFLPQARAIVNDMTAAIVQMKQSSSPSGGVLTLACVPSMTVHVIPGLIHDFANLYPGTRIRLLDGTSDQVRQSVIHRRAELGIAVNGPAHPELMETNLFDDPLVLICQDTHELHARKSITWSDLKSVDLIMVSNFVATRIFTDYQLAKKGIELRSRFEVQHHATAINLVAAGVGAAILPASTYRPGDRTHVRVVPIIQPVVKRKVALIRKRNSPLSPAGEAFLKLLERQFPRTGRLGHKDGTKV